MAFIYGGGRGTREEDCPSLCCKRGSYSGVDPMKEKLVLIVPKNRSGDGRGRRRPEKENDRRSGERGEL